MRVLPTIFVSLLLLPVTAMSSSPDGENLLQKVPDGYKVDFTVKQKKLLVAEMVPESESVKNWTEMLTVQVFQGLRSTTPSQYQNRMQTTWSTGCKGFNSESIAQGSDNDYDYSVWLQKCPNNPGTGKAENTIFKAIRGSDNFYVVQKAFKFEPSKKQLAKWTTYLETVTVCDSRLAGRSCDIAE